MTLLYKILNKLFFHQRFSQKRCSYTNLLFFFLINQIEKATRHFIYLSINQNQIMNDDTRGDRDSYIIINMEQKEGSCSPL
jgi:hypothetical protein